MSAISAVSLLTDLLQVANALITQASTISAVIKKAQDENRPISPEEWTAIDGDQLAARTAAITAVSKL